MSDPQRRHGFVAEVHFNWPAVDTPHSFCGNWQRTSTEAQGTASLSALQGLLCELLGEPVALKGGGFALDVSSSSSGRTALLQVGRPEPSHPESGNSSVCTPGGDRKAGGSAAAATTTLASRTSSGFTDEAGLATTATPASRTSIGFVAELGLALTADFLMCALGAHAPGSDWYVPGEARREYARRALDKLLVAVGALRLVRFPAPPTPPELVLLTTPDELPDILFSVDAAKQGIGRSRADKFAASWAPPAASYRQEPFGGLGDLNAYLTFMISGLVLLRHNADKAVVITGWPHGAEHGHCYSLLDFVLCAETRAPTTSARGKVQPVLLPDGTPPGRLPLEACVALARTYGVTTVFEGCSTLPAGWRFAPPPSPRVGSQRLPAGGGEGATASATAPDATSSAAVVSTAEAGVPGHRDIPVPHVIQLGSAAVLTATKQQQVRELFTVAGLQRAATLVTNRQVDHPCGLLGQPEQGNMLTPSSQMKLVLLEHSSRAIAAAVLVLGPPASRRTGERRPSAVTTIAALAVDPVYRSEGRADARVSGVGRLLYAACLKAAVGARCQHLAVLSSNEDCWGARRNGENTWGLTTDVPRKSAAMGGGSVAVLSPYRVTGPDAPIARFLDLSPTSLCQLARQWGRVPSNRGGETREDTSVALLALAASQVTGMSGAAPGPSGSLPSQPPAVGGWGPAGSAPSRPPSAEGLGPLPPKRRRRLAKSAAVQPRDAAVLAVASPAMPREWTVLPSPDESQPICASAAFLRASWWNASLNRAAWVRVGCMLTGNLNQLETPTWTLRELEPVGKDVLYAFALAAKLSVRCLLVDNETGSIAAWAELSGAPDKELVRHIEACLEVAWQATVCKDTKPPAASGFRTIEVLCRTSTMDKLTHHMELVIPSPQRANATEGDVRLSDSDKCGVKVELPSEARFGVDGVHGRTGVHADLPFIAGSDEDEDADLPFIAESDEDGDADLPFIAGSDEDVYADLPFLRPLSRSDQDMLANEAAAEQAMGSVSTLGSSHGAGGGGSTGASP